MAIEVLNPAIIDTVKEAPIARPSMKLWRASLRVTIHATVLMLDTGVPRSQWHITCPDTWKSQKKKKRNITFHVCEKNAKNATSVEQCFNDTHKGRIVFNVKPEKRPTNSEPAGPGWRYTIMTKHPFISQTRDPCAQARWFQPSGGQKSEVFSTFYTWDFPVKY